MGHSRIGTLPRSRAWKEVVRLIGGGADVRNVAAATAKAADHTLEQKADDPVLHHAFYLLTQIPLAARSDDAVDSFRRLGLLVGPVPSLIEITGALMEALDRLIAASGRHRSDLGEMAQLAAVESLHAVAGNAARTLLGPSHACEDARIALRGLGTAKQFGVLGRDFFARLMRRCLDYYLSRELSNHVGANGRFRSLQDHRLFEDALDAHCRESARIVEGFASDWFSKANYEGGITPEKAGGFVHQAFRKLRRELRHPGPDGAAAA
jgi:hypothetical protein